jgi:hypothetical protein
MSRAASVLSSAIATLAMSLCALALMTSGNPAHAATCNAAPNSPAPEGSHWYYRTDRATQRKCWYLASQGHKVQAAPRVVPRVNAVAEPPAPPVTEPVRLTRPVEPGPVEAPAAIAEQAVVIAPGDAPAAQLPNRPVNATERAQEPSTSAQEPARADVQDSVPIERPMQPAVPANDATELPAAGISTIQFALIALAAICFFTCAVLYAAAARRRRTGVSIVDLNTKTPLRMPATVAGTTAPGLAADATGRLDDVEIDEERLRQFSQAWKRQAA